jgi:regulator of PEP synthase PpsR (kinase-PPPase family)
MKQFNLHLVSDSTGETVSSVARAAMAQFDGIEPEENIWSLIRTKGQMEKVIASIQERPGMVLFTIVQPNLREMLTTACREMNTPCVPVLNSVVSEFATYLRMPVKASPGKQYELTEEYFTRVEALNFALTHDDGQATWNLEEADIVLVGPSRTSKSPTCIYLANRGFKAANVPYVAGVDLPQELFQLKKPFVVGLTIDMERLLQIRRTRLQSMKDTSNQDYIDPEGVHAEIMASRKLFVAQRWPVIDVSRRSVEETAATIIQKYRDRYGTSHPQASHGS